jgi:hypothetical protein
LKEFLWQLDGIGEGNVLELGPVWQATIGFFLEHGFKVYAEDLLGSWRRFQEEEQERQRRAAAARTDAAPLPDEAPSAAAERFLASNLIHARDTFDAVLLWDLLDYLDRETASAVVGRLTSLVRDGGAVLAVFHTRISQEFTRYRMLDGNNLEVVPAPMVVPQQHVYQNREIQDLFSRFRTSKSFVGRDQLREVVFVK